MKKNVLAYFFVFGVSILKKKTLKAQCHQLFSGNSHNCTVHVRTGEAACVYKPPLKYVHVPIHANAASITGRFFFS